MAINGDAVGVDRNGSWLTYRPDVRVLDCTVRDGGLVNDSNFDDDFVRSVYNACVAGGVDYMELGYKSSRKIYSSDKYGAWKFCSEDDIRRIVGENDTPLKLSVMADAERTDYHEDILPRDRSVIDMVRVATYIHQIPTAIDMIEDAHQKGYETCVNIMATSTVNERELDEALELLAKTNVCVIYLVDSFGAFYSEDIRQLTKKYLGIVAGTDKKIGIHCHNNQQLAYSNTIEALILGASYLDSTIAGLGRGAGNCHTELLLGFLKNPKFHLRPILQCIQDTMVPFKEKNCWGFDIPYMLTGQLNQHPRSAMSFLDGDDKTNYIAFYDKIMEEE